MNHGSGPLLVLVVEDHEDLRDLLAEALRSAGYTVLAAKDAEEGLAHLRRGGIGAIVTDHMLGASGTGCWMLAVAAGEGLLGAVRSIVICTGSPHVEAPEGVDAAVTRKPIDVDAIKSRIARALAA